MKKIVILFSAILLSTAVYGQFGIKAGFNFNSMKDFNVNDLQSSFEGKTGFHVGVLYKLDLPLGLALQPELMYTQKGGSTDINGKRTDLKMNYIQLPVNLQWGIDLVLFRPFIMVSPYIGYAIAKGSGVFKKIEWKNLNKFEYGIGIGAGLEIWKFQLSGRYCWDLDTMSDFKDGKAGGDNPYTDAVKAMDGGKNRGFELSLAFLF